MSIEIKLPNIDNNNNNNQMDLPEQCTHTHLCKCFIGCIATGSMTLQTSSSFICLRFREGKEQCHRCESLSKYESVVLFSLFFDDEICDALFWNDDEYEDSMHGNNLKFLLSEWPFNDASVWISNADYCYSILCNSVHVHDSWPPIIY